MASIINRKGSVSVVYRIDGKQYWESGFTTQKAAKERKREIEHQINNGGFVAPSPLTVEEYPEEYVAVYGKTKWAYSTYSNSIALIRNYILPNIGKTPLKNITTKMMDEFLLRLKNQKAADRPGRKSSGRVSHKIIRDIHVLLRSAFRQAVVWGNIPKNPLDEAVKPVYKSKKRDFWHPDTAVKAIAHSPDDDFGVCLDIALALSMRIGEILGLRWSCVKFGDVQNGFKGACVRIECELQRVEKDALEALNRTEDLLLVFPNGKKLRKEAKSTLVLKIPKTETSVRTVWIPPALAEKLQKHKERQNKSKEELGDEYTDYDLVIAYNNGRPCEPGRMYKSLRKFSSENGFQKVCFHSFRHTSTSVKLKLSGGDIKSVQGDTGHAQASMVTDIYAEIIDSDRERTAMMINDLFYPENGVEKNRPLSENETVSLVKRCLQSPDGTKQLLSVISEIIAGGSL